ncbi:MAG: hypothetical protein LUC93_18255 [Planctomycetaceae bacterium]|nr:hypothetical protein [Planctomycetaceae bacterium]
MRKMSLVILCIFIFSTSAWALSYYGYYGEPTVSDIDEMSEVLQSAVSTINDLESKIYDLESQIADLEFRVSMLE